MARKERSAWRGFSGEGAACDEAGMARVKVRVRGEKMNAVYRLWCFERSGGPSERVGEGKREKGKCTNFVVWEISESCRSGRRVGFTQNFV